MASINNQVQYVLFNQDLIDLITYIGIVKYSINFAY